jgi:hypothetical protein
MLITISDLLGQAFESANWLQDRKNSRSVPHRFEACGYVAVRNEGAKTGCGKSAASDRQSTEKLP